VITDFTFTKYVFVDKKSFSSIGELNHFLKGNDLILAKSSE